VLTLTTKVVPSNSHGAYNNAIWFLVTSKYVATLFAVLSLTRLWRRLDRTGRCVMAAIVAAICFPSTVQHMYKLSSPKQHELPSPVLQTTDFLNSQARPGEIVLSRLNDPILALTELRIPVYAYFTESFANREVAAGRRQDIETFGRHGCKEPYARISWKSTE
jgi:hypothetical protein